MSGDRPATDLGVEREIDLRRWKDAVLAYWWVAVAGLVLGIVVGSVYSLGGGTSYTASATIARGQVFNPAGTSSVLGYLSSPVAIQNFVTAPATLDKVATKIGIGAGELRGHVSVATLTDTGVPSTANTNSILIQITVRLSKPKKAEDAANALAALVKSDTTSSYVRESIAQYKVKLGNYAARIKTLQTRIASVNAVLANPAGLTALDQLLVASELDSAEASLGQTLDSQTTVQQELTLAELVETTQIIPPPAKAQKTLARSRRNSVLFGALIGLVLGSIAATVYGLRARRTSPA